jgi:hypothetical protein
MKFEIDWDEVNAGMKSIMMDADRNLTNEHEVPNYNPIDLLLQDSSDLEAHISTWQFRHLMKNYKGDNAEPRLEG